jgi:membrane associated rhomboid family serine protease
MRGYSPFGANNFSTQDTPLTWALIAANFITLVLITFRVLDPLWLVLSVPGAFSRPWTFITYPLISFGIIGMLFYGLWLYFIGSALERAWGTFNYAIFFVVVSVVSGIAMEIGALITQHDLVIDNWLPLAGVTLAFCLLMPDETIFLLIFPIRAKWLGWLEMVIVFFTYAGTSPLLGIFALAGCGVAWFWVTNRIPDKTGSAGFRTGNRGSGGRSFRPHDPRSWKEKINPIEIWKRYKRRRQFDRLMRGDKK